MEQRPLGRTGLSVSVIGLGTMTWGEQNTEAEAHAQLDRAVDAGINLIDVAEMYPVPPKAETQGRTEAYVGSWVRSRGRHDDVLIATKVTGPADFPWIRGGRHRHVAADITAACEGSLRRLGVDHIDLYQLHWPDRATNFFGSLGYTHQPDAPFTPPETSLRALEDLVTAGKVRHVGLSNETPWGAMRFLADAERLGLPRPASVQNPYNLLNRSYEVGLAEVSLREDCGLLAYSPLAMGVLTGKYEGGRVMPQGSRLELFDRFQRYRTEAAWTATDAYVAIAREAGLDPGQMALAFINRQPFLTSNLIGATTMAQLDSNIASADVVLSDDVLAAIEAVHLRSPNPCP